MGTTLQNVMQQAGWEYILANLQNALQRDEWCKAQYLLATVPNNIDAVSRSAIHNLESDLILSMKRIGSDLDLSYELMSAFCEALGDRVSEDLTNSIFISAMYQNDTRMMGLVTKYQHGTGCHGAKGRKCYLKCIERGYINVIEFIVRNGMRPMNLHDRDLKVAIAHKHVEIVKLLLQSGVADIHSIESDGCPAKYRRWRGGNRIGRYMTKSRRHSTLQKVYNKHDWEMLRVLLTSGVNASKLRPPLPKEVINVLTMTDDSDDSDEL